MNNASGNKPKKSNKRLSVERIYQKKTQLEHILLRPDAYIGSVEPTKQQMWVWEEDRKCMVNREITFVPGLYKIFDEILGMLNLKWQISLIHIPGIFLVYIDFSLYK
jgi:DNA topoisomerase-2